MATYNGVKQNIFDGVLGEFSDCGFTLKEDGDHIAILRFKEKEIARYNQVTLTPSILQEGCRDYLDNITKWD